MLTRCEANHFPPRPMSILADSRLGVGVQIPLGDIINLSLLSETFPVGLKEAVVCPLFYKAIVASYSPVSILLFLGMIVGTVVASQL